MSAWDTGVFAIEFECALRFIREIHELRNRCLHAVRHFISPDPGQDFGITDRCLLNLVQLCDAIEHAPAIRRAGLGGVSKVKHRIAHRPELDALMA